MPPARKPFCTRGHDQAIHRGIDKKGLPFCRECGRLAARRYGRRAKVASELVQLLRAGADITTTTEWRRWRTYVTGYLARLDRETDAEPLHMPSRKAS